MAAGDRLILAMKVENDFNHYNPGQDLAVLRKQWIECRKILELFADDYAEAVQKWRVAVQENAVAAHALEPTPRVSFSFFQRCVEGALRKQAPAIQQLVASWDLLRRMNKARR